MTMYKFNVLTILVILSLFSLILLFFPNMNNRDARSYDDEPKNISENGVHSAPFKYNGKGLVLPSIDYLIEDKYPNVELLSLSSRRTGTHFGIKKLLDRKCSIVFTTRPINREEFKMALARKIDPICVPIGYLPLCILVNKANPIKSIDLKSLRSIARGKISNWETLNNDKQEIAFLSWDLEATSMFQKLVLKGDKIPDSQNLVNVRRSSLIHEIYRNKNAIGYSFGATTSLNDFPVKVVSINNYSPSPANIRGNKYPLVQPVYAILDANTDHNSPEFDFIKYLLSNKGATLMQQKTALIPIIEPQINPPVKKSARQD